MKIVISYKSDVPMYQQIYDGIASQILSGKIEADFCLPSIRTVAKELNISVITVKNAWELLEKNGYIYTQAGRGCYVADMAKKHIDKKRYHLAKQKLTENFTYLKTLGLSKEDIKKLTDEVLDV